MGLSLIGRVAKPHGIRGYFNVIPDQADARLFLPLTRIFLGTTRANAVEFGIAAARIHTTRRGTALQLCAEGVASPEEADALRGLLAFADEDVIQSADHDQESAECMTGFTVETVDGVEVGVLKEVWEAPANDIFVVSRTGREDAMIPAVPAFISFVDAEHERILVRPIEGMLD